MLVCEETPRPLEEGEQTDDASQAQKDGQDDDRLETRAVMEGEVADYRQDAACGDDWYPIKGNLELVVAEIQGERW